MGEDQTSVNDRLVAMHGAMSIAELAAELGLTRSAVRGRITRLGIAKKRQWTADEERQLRDAYLKAGVDGPLNLTALAEKMGRNVGNLSRKAASLGLSVNQRRRKVEVRKPTRRHPTDEQSRAAISAAVKSYIATKGHPRGMLGRRHSDKTRAVISKASADMWAQLSDEERQHRIDKIAIANSIRGPEKTKRGSWAAGWREIGDKRIYFRSRWEANYAFYLEWLMSRGEIKSWEYEPKTFWFEAIKRGVRSYKPDFFVTENSGAQSYHEVKGWKDSRSKTTLARMAKYYPDVTVIVIDESVYRSIRKTALGLVPGWEDSARDRRL